MGLHDAVADSVMIVKDHTQFCFHHMAATVVSGEPHCRRVKVVTGPHGDAYTQFDDGVRRECA